MRPIRHVVAILIAGSVAACGNGSASTASTASASTTGQAAMAVVPDRTVQATAASASPDPAPADPTPGGVSTAATPIASSSPASGAETLAAVESRLDRMLTAASHCTSDAECRSVAVGGKACGGPTGYRAYSARLADPAAVEALARQDHALATQADRDAHRVSNCLFMADPGAHCEKQHCEIGTNGDGPLPPRDGASTR